MPSCERDDCPSCPVDDAKDCGYLAAEQRGAARVLREIQRTVETPWQLSGHGPDICIFCDASDGRSDEPEGSHRADCLWLRALAAGRDEAR